MDEIVLRFLQSELRAQGLPARFERAPFPAVQCGFWSLYPLGPESFALHSPQNDLTFLRPADLADPALGRRLAQLIRGQDLA